MLISSHLDLMLTVNNPYILTRGIECIHMSKLSCNWLPLVVENYIFVTVPVIKNHKQFKANVKRYKYFLVFMITWKLECPLTFPILDSSTQSLRTFDNTRCKLQETSFCRISFTRSLQLIETGFESSRGTDIRHPDLSTANSVARMDPPRTRRLGIS